MWAECEQRVLSVEAMNHEKTLRTTVLYKECITFALDTENSYFQFTALIALTLCDIVVAVGSIVMGRVGSHVSTSLTRY